MEKKTSYKQVEGHPDLVRDTTSHAIINTNVTAFEKARSGGGGVSVSTLP